MKDKPSPRLLLDLSCYPKLDIAQAGHLRHFHNLSSQLDGEWNHMAGFEPLQELFDSYRYQLSLMAYAAGAAHFHRLPAARSVYKQLLDQIIHKMLLRDVWGYWFNASMSGNFIDPGRTELRMPWADPIIKENIMYSGHLLMMTSLYAMLFDDDKYERPGSLTLCWDPVLWGMGNQTFAYDNRSIQTAVVTEMERSRWLGVCCNPNLVFIVCNQFPIIAMRYNDVRDGTNIAGEVLEKYKEAWDKRGMVAPDGLYHDWLYFNQDQTEPPSDICFTAWANAFMNTWNSELVNSLYERQALGYITNIDGQVRLHDHSFAVEYRKIVQAKTDNKMTRLDDTAALVAEARAQRTINRPTPDKYTDPVLGCVLQWLSELGKTAELQGLLDYADSHLHPTWENGGLFYPRKDPDPPTEPDEWSHMDPFTGNAGIPYARLNVPNGQKKMWEAPWTRDFLATQPWIDNITLSEGVDTLRAFWDANTRSLILTQRTWDGKQVTVQPIARNLPAGVWAVYVDGKLEKCESIVKQNRADTSLSIVVTVGGEDVNVVFQQL